jgi:hypothetical protein
MLGFLPTGNTGFWGAGEVLARGPSQQAVSGCSHLQVREKAMGPKAYSVVATPKGGNPCSLKQVHIQVWQ